MVDIALRQGDFGWVLRPEALDALIADRHEITRSLAPEPVAHWRIFDFGWALFRDAADDVSQAKPLS